jgi:cell division control protein 6
MDDDLFDSILRTESVFKNQSSLTQAWVPNREQKLLCRDDVIKKLAAIHRPIADDKGNFSANTLILGTGGVGKTLTTKYFTSRFIESVKKREPSMEIITEYYDCLQHRSKSSILRHISEKLHSLSGGHGYSDNEIMKQILLQLRRNNKYLFIILDEVHNLPSDDILAILNSSIGFGEQNSRFSIICISRPNDWYKVNNEKISSRIQEIIRMEPYNKAEALDILRYRRQIAFRDGILGDEELELVADIVNETKSMRTGIDIIRACGLRCDEQNFNRITMEMIRESRSDINPTFRSEIIDQLKPHEHLTLAAIALAIKQSQEPFTGVDEAYQQYELLCEEYSRSPHVKMSFRKYVRNLASVKAVDAEYQNPTKDKKGRQLKIFLSDISAEKLVELLRTIIPNENDE